MEKENAQLKKLVANQALDLSILKEVAEGAEWNETAKGAAPFARRAAPAGAGNMAGPERKREAVLHVQDELEVSGRQACTTIGQPRAA